MKKRIISAAIMLAITIPLILIGGVPFKIFSACIGILAYREIMNLKGIRKYPLPVVLLGLVSMLLLTIPNTSLAYNFVGLDFKRIIGVFFLMFIPVIYYYGKNNYTHKDAFYLSTFISLIGISLNLLTNILITNKPYFWLILIVTIMTDTFAYFTGVMIGKHKFTKISPNKTIEGCIGGLAMGMILSSIYYMMFIGSVAFYRVILCTLFMAIMCEVGDLFFSAIKREYNIKDFSKLIPGHGGVLDRLDSLTFVTLAYVLINAFI